MDRDSDYDDVCVLPTEKDNRPSKDNFVRKPPGNSIVGNMSGVVIGSGRY